MAKFIERDTPAASPEEARQRRARAMTGLGAVALAWGLITLVAADAGKNVAVPVVLALIGGVVLVGGLILRR